MRWRPILMQSRPTPCYDPAVLALIAKASDFLQTKAATTLGYAVHSLASTYNKLATECKEALFKAQSLDIRTALADTRPGFDDVSTSLAIAAQTAQLRLTQVTLAQLSSSGRQSAFLQCHQGQRGGSHASSHSAACQSQSRGSHSTSASSRRPPYCTQWRQGHLAPRHRGGAKTSTPHDK